MQRGSCFSSLHSVLMDGDVPPVGNEEFILPFCSEPSELTFPEHIEELPRKSYKQ
jgi:hypothetical protein